MKKQKGKTKALVVPCNAGHRSAGYSEKDFDERVLHRGAKVEFEHTRNVETAERIAMDHIVEGKNYYELLEQMEKKLIPYKGMEPKPRVNKRCNKPVIVKHRKRKEKEDEDLDDGLLTTYRMIKPVNRFEDLIK